MKLLNLGCGGDRPQDPTWTNLDQLRTFLHPGTPERTNLDRETNYIEWDLLANKTSPTLPGAPYHGIVWQHGPEHFECHDAATIAEQCFNSLHPNGMLIMSAPDASYFQRVYDHDNRTNAVALFGEPISEPQYQTFFDYALWHREHKQILGLSSMFAILTRAGFSKTYLRDGMSVIINRQMPPDHWLGKAKALMEARLTRLKFSVVLYALR